MESLPVTLLQVLAQTLQIYSLVLIVRVLPVSYTHLRAHET